MESNIGSDSSTIPLPILYDAARFINRLVLPNQFHGNSGTDIFPSGPKLLALNHTSLLDVPVSGIALQERYRYVAKKELFDLPLLGTIIEKAGSIAVDRSHPKANTIKEIRRTFQNGENVAIFVGGGINNIAETILAKSGAAAFAISADVPVIAGGIVYRRTKRNIPYRSWVHFTGPLFPPNKNDSASLTREEKVKQREIFSNEIVQAISRSVAIAQDRLKGSTL